MSGMQYTAKVPTDEIQHKDSSLNYRDKCSKEILHLILEMEYSKEILHLKDKITNLEY